MAHRNRSCLLNVTKRPGCQPAPRAQFSFIQNAINFALGPEHAALMPQTNLAPLNKGGGPQVGGISQHIEYHPGCCSNCTAWQVFCHQYNQQRILLSKSHNADEEYSIEVDPRTTFLQLDLYFDQSLPDIQITMPLCTFLKITSTRCSFLTS